jgi:hypothetical protein
MLSLRGDVFRGALLGAALFGVGLTAGCGGGEPADSGGAKSDQVASISGAATPAAAQSGGGQEGVMLRVDMTEADRQAVWRTYYACLETNGVRMMQKQKAGEKIPAQEEREAPAGYRACTAKKPYLDPLVDKTKNPQYADQFRAWLRCMNSRGIEVSGSPDDEFLNFGKRAPGIDSAKYLDIYRQCEVASYKW